MDNNNSEWNVKGEWSDDRHHLKTNVPVFIFTEDDIYYTYIPAFDILGYGYNEDEAKQSLETSLFEFFKYTHNKNTFVIELRRLGWKIKKAKKNYEAPSISEQLTSNEQLRDIINNKQYKTSNFDVSMPAFA